MNGRSTSKPDTAVQQLVAEKKIDVQYIPTEDQVADVFTKGLLAEKLATMKKKLGIWTSSDEPSRVSLAETTRRLVPDN